jgi:hypothetical protein
MKADPPRAEAGMGWLTRRALLHCVNTLYRQVGRNAEHKHTSKTQQALVA